MRSNPHRHHQRCTGAERCSTRAIYDERRLAFLEEAKILAAVLDFGPARAGMHVTGLFKAGMSRRLDDRSVAPECARSGVEAQPLSKYGATNCGGLVFGFAEAFPGCRALGPGDRAAGDQRMMRFGWWATSRGPFASGSL